MTTQMEVDIRAACEFARNNVDPKPAGLNTLIQRSVIEAFDTDLGAYFKNNETIEGARGKVVKCEEVYRQASGEKRELARKELFDAIDELERVALTQAEEGVRGKSTKW